MIKDFIRQLRIFFIRMLTFCNPSLPLPEVAIVIAPHPDDEVFGCCGLMQRMLAEGKQVDLIIMTGGGKSHSSCCNVNEEVLISERRQLTRNAAAIYGLGEEHIHFLNYPDGGVQFSNENTKELMRTLAGIDKSISASNVKVKVKVNLKVNVSIFYPHQLGEGWRDHLRTSEIAKQLCASIFPDAKQYEYCVWFWFYNCWKIDWKRAFTYRMTQDEHACKLKAIDAYIEPKAPCGKPWSGVLPPVFLRANKWRKELYFNIK